VTSYRAKRSTAPQDRIGSLAVIVLVISVILFGFCELVSASGTLLKEPPTHAAFMDKMGRTSTFAAQRPHLMREQCFDLPGYCVSTLVIMGVSAILLLHLDAGFANGLYFYPAFFLC